MYSKFLKRTIDFLLSLVIIIVLSPFFLLLVILGAITMKGNPFFTQLRIGKNEKIFRLIKFRTVACNTDADANPLLDEQPLSPYGKFLRSTSLDAFPELFNILKGDMAIVGPQPLSESDMVFMTKEHRRRYTVRQGMTGLAQVSGCNAETWMDKLDYDVRYVQNLSFMVDFFIVLKAIEMVLERERSTEEEKVFK